MNFPISNLNKSELFDSFKGIVSVWGDFGVGKTTFALQTVLNEAKLGKKVIYIYSKPNFPSDKVNNILQNDQDIEFIDENVINIQTTNFEDLNSIIFNLEFLILNNLKQKEKLLNLIVVDSLTDLYRMELNKEKKEINYKLNLKLNQILANLCYINKTYNIEILIVNELSRKSDDIETKEIQSGGKVMDYWISYNIKIERSDTLNERKISLYKPPEIKILETQSKLTEIGFI